jgi:hypothetical protein
MTCCWIPSHTRFTRICGTDADSVHWEISYRSTQAEYDKGGGVWTLSYTIGHVAISLVLIHCGKNLPIARHWAEANTDSRVVWSFRLTSSGYDHSPLTNDCNKCSVAKKFETDSERLVILVGACYFRVFQWQIEFDAPSSNVNGAIFRWG